MTARFNMNGINFHISRNYYQNEFEGSHKLTFLNGYGSWQRVTTCDSIKEAMDWITHNKAYFM